MTTWNNASVLPKPLLNVIVRVSNQTPINNDSFMVAHHVPKFFDEFNGDDDWFDYCETRDMNFVKEGWYANTTYIGDDISSYYIHEQVLCWKNIND